MTSYLKDGRNIDVHVNVEDNPNYSDCDENGNKKSKIVTPGN
jgi:hypothetical protein